MIVVYFARKCYTCAFAFHYSVRKEQSGALPPRRSAASAELVLFFVYMVFVYATFALRTSGASGFWHRYAVVEALFCQSSPSALLSFQSSGRTSAVAVPSASPFVYSALGIASTLMLCSL